MYSLHYKFEYFDHHVLRLQMFLQERGAPNFLVRYVFIHKQTETQYIVNYYGCAMFMDKFRISSSIPSDLK